MPEMAYRDISQGVEERVSCGAVPVGNRRAVRPVRSVDERGGMAAVLDDVLAESGRREYVMQGGAGTARMEGALLQNAQDQQCATGGRGAYLARSCQMDCAAGRLSRAQRR